VTTPAAPIAVVTGAAYGICRATALRLADDGFRLVLIDLDEAGLAETAATLSANGAPAAFFQVDLRDAHAVGNAARQIALTVGTPAVLANVAGLSVAASVMDTSDEDWGRIIGVNLTGAFLMTRSLLPLMLDRGAGVIVNVASTAAVVGMPRRAAYCASNAGLVGLTRAIAVDHGAQGIRCVAICPGLVETESIETIIEGAPDPAAARRELADRQLDGRMGTPQEIADVVAFVVSPLGRFINGAVMVVDGGTTAA
jgi:Dehydrogenases with different specificities (related to short-chain alcohol dehydrogenases)